MELEQEVIANEIRKIDDRLEWFGRLTRSIIKAGYMDQEMVADYIDAVRLNLKMLRVREMLVLIGRKHFNMDIE